MHSSKFQIPILLKFRSVMTKFLTEKILSFIQINCEPSRCFVCALLIKVSKPAYSFDAWVQDAFEWVFAFILILSSSKIQLDCWFLVHTLKQLSSYKQLSSAVLFSLPYVSLSSWFLAKYNIYSIRSCKIVVAREISYVLVFIFIWQIVF